MLDRIVVTGLGIISSIGIGQQSTLHSLMHEQSGIGKVKYLDTIHTELPVGEVQCSDEELRRELNIDSQQNITRTPLLGIMAVREALDDAKIVANNQIATAFVNGTTVGGMEKGEQYYCDFFKGKNIEYIASQDSGVGTDVIADYFGGFDIVTTSSTACSSALNSIILGAELIANGRVDRAVVGGAECLSKFHLNGFNSLMILDHEPCRPFDITRKGLNLGEGAAYLVLERESMARARGANLYCLLSGYGNRCDAYHQTASSPNGEGARLAMEEALRCSGLQPCDIDYINAHGTGTENNDISEVKALERLFGSDCPYVSSTKSYTGHTTSAAGSVESVISILAMNHGFVPRNLNLVTPIESKYVKPNKATITDLQLSHVMCNSFGFGGNDSSCIFSKLN